MNSFVEKLPQHLKQYIVPQEYHLYTAQNQAVWRYVMRMNLAFLSNKAHDSYVQGLKDTGISLEHIPSMDEMNEKLSKIGWAAVAVDGFIPPNCFMEFQAYQILVIAADIRTLEHIAYTPAPDIIHEAAGHAPIIANREYAEYLRRFGEIGSKAISSAHDVALYEAVRHLSILKENPNANQGDVIRAEERVNFLQNQEVTLSEMAQLRNLHWWTVEYGLIGTLENPKIYGAGLLSSIGESESCLKTTVQKIPYSLATTHQNFDISKPQPLLFVTPDFAHLSLVLEEFAHKMALRKGGKSGLEKLIASKNLGTITLSTGLQISGVFTDYLCHEENQVMYLQTASATALAYHEKELIAHGTSHHREGFGSPIGTLKGINLAIEDMSPADLEAYGIYEGKEVALHFEGGILVQGEIITGMRNLAGKIMLISFKNCTVTYGDKVLFQPEWGTYDMAVGKKIVSCFAGPADATSFSGLYPVPQEKTQKIQYRASEKKLHSLYQEVRTMRETNTVSSKKLTQIFENLVENYPKEWLLFLELYELSVLTTLRAQTLAHLKQLQKYKALEKLIADGLQCYV